jgi:hypothetical protein
MAQSLACGERVTLSKVDAFAGGAAGLLAPSPWQQHTMLLDWPETHAVAWASLEAELCCPPALPCLPPVAALPAPADGVAVKFVGAETFRLCRDLVDGVVLVDNAATSAAIKVS